MKEGKDIDRFFKDKLENPDIPFSEMDWDTLEDRLYPEKRKRIAPIAWLTVLSGIAALLVIAFFVLKPQLLNKKEEMVHRKKNTQKGGGLSESVGTTVAPIDIPGSKEQLIKEKPVWAGVIENQPFASKAKIDNENQLNGVINPTLLSLPQKNGDVVSLISLGKTASFNGSLASLSPALGTKVKNTDITIRKKPVLMLSILAAPDLTSVQKSGRSSLSGGFGIEATLSLTKKLSITTGAVYAKKIYDSDFSLYSPNTNYVFRVKPSNIHANCDVIDIPLNINYKVFENSKNAISVSTGLSSYLMLKEKYNYSYDGNYQGPQAYEVRNQNQHYMGVANVGLEFQHKINEKISISAKPFMKLPLTGIGYGNSRLSSTGVAVSVNMNLFKKGN